MPVSSDRCGGPVSLIDGAPGQLLTLHTIWRPAAMPLFRLRHRTCRVFCWKILPWPTPSSQSASPQKSEPPGACPPDRFLMLLRCSNCTESSSYDCLLHQRTSMHSRSHLPIARSSCSVLRRTIGRARASMLRTNLAISSCTLNRSGGRRRWSTKRTASRLRF